MLSSRKMIQQSLTFFRGGQCPRQGGHFAPRQGSVYPAIRGVNLIRGKVVNLSAFSRISEYP